MMIESEKEIVASPNNCGRLTTMTDNNSDHDTKRAFIYPV